MIERLHVSRTYTGRYESREDGWGGHLLDLPDVYVRRSSSLEDAQTFLQLRADEYVRTRITRDASSIPVPIRFQPDDRFIDFPVVINFIDLRISGLLALALVRSQRPVAKWEDIAAIAHYVADGTDCGNEISYLITLGQRLVEDEMLIILGQRLVEDEMLSTHCNISLAKYEGKITWAETRHTRQLLIGLSGLREEE